jgi:hypothetical protein
MNKNIILISTIFLDLKGMSSLIPMTNNIAKADNAGKKYLAIGSMVNPSRITNPNTAKKQKETNNIN